jgi:hypothetical protein
MKLRSCEVAKLRSCEVAVAWFFEEDDMAWDAKMTEQHDPSDPASTWPSPTIVGAALRHSTKVLKYAANHKPTHGVVLN